MVAWLLGCLVACLLGWLLAWLVAWLVAWLLAWLVGWLLGCLDAMMDVIPGAETAPNLHHFAAGEPVAQLSPERAGDLGCQSRQKWDGPAMSPPKNGGPTKIEWFCHDFPIQLGYFCVY